MTLTRKSLSKLVAQDTGLNLRESEAAVSSVIENLTDTLAKKDKVTLRGFGGFSVKNREARKGRNPATGEVVDIPATVTPHFKPSPILKDQIQ